MSGGRTRTLQRSRDEGDELNTDVVVGAPSFSLHCVALRKETTLGLVARKLSQLTPFPTPPLPLFSGGVITHQAVGGGERSPWPQTPLL